MKKWFRVTVTLIVVLACFLSVPLGASASYVQWSGVFESTGDCSQKTYLIYDLDDFKEAAYECTKALSAQEDCTFVLMNDIETDITGDAYGNFIRFNGGGKEVDVTIDLNGYNIKVTSDNVKHFISIESWVNLYFINSQGEDGDKWIEFNTKANGAAVVYASYPRCTITNYNVRFDLDWQEDYASASSSTEAVFDLYRCKSAYFLGGSIYANGYGQYGVRAGDSDSWALSMQDLVFAGNVSVCANNKPALVYNTDLINGKVAVYGASFSGGMGPDGERYLGSRIMVAGNDNSQYKLIENILADYDNISWGSYDGDEEWYDKYGFSGAPSSYVRDLEFFMNCDINPSTRWAHCFMNGDVKTCLQCGGYVSTSDECHGIGQAGHKNSVFFHAGEISGMRLAGSSRFDTALEVASAYKKANVKTQLDAIIVAYGMDSADALAGNYLSYVKTAPIVTVNANSEEKVRQYIYYNLKENGTVYILGGTSVVSKAFENSLSGFNVKRLAGATRFDTNIAILKEAGVTDEDIMVCTAFNYADSLSASAVSKPILLVNPNGLNDAQKAYLNTLNTDKFYVIGGELAVSKNAENQVKAYGAVERIAGGNRFETSVKIADKFTSAEKYKTVVLAYGLNFPDGLAGGPLANSIGAPLILTEARYLDTAKEFVEANGVDKYVVLGGEGLISDANVDYIMGN